MYSVSHLSTINIYKLLFRVHILCNCWHTHSAVSAPTATMLCLWCAIIESCTKSSLKQALFYQKLICNNNCDYPESIKKKSWEFFISLAEGFNSFTKYVSDTKVKEEKHSKNFMMVDWPCFVMMVWVQGQWLQNQVSYSYQQPKHPQILLPLFQGWSYTNMCDCIFWTRTDNNWPGNKLLRYSLCFILKG